MRSAARSEEHTSELQSRGHLVCRLLLEKKKKVRYKYSYISLTSCPKQQREATKVCVYFFFFLTIRPPPISTLFPYTTLFRSRAARAGRSRCASSAGSDNGHVHNGH